MRRIKHSESVFDAAKKDFIRTAIPTFPTAQSGSPQQARSHLQPSLNQIIHWRNPDHPAEQPAEIIGTQAHLLRQKIQYQRTRTDPRPSGPRGIPAKRRDGCLSMPRPRRQARTCWRCCYASGSARRRNPPPRNGWPLVSKRASGPTPRSPGRFKKCTIENRRAAKSRQTLPNQSSPPDFAAALSFLLFFRASGGTGPASRTKLDSSFSQRAVMSCTRSGCSAARSCCSPRSFARL